VEQIWFFDRAIQFVPVILYIYDENIFIMMCIMPPSIIRLLDWDLMALSASTGYRYIMPPKKVRLTGDVYFR